MDLRQTLGDAVRQRRLELGLSQVELAGRMRGNIQQSDISRIERGYLPWPRPDLLDSVASGLGLRTIELMRLSGWMTPADFERYSKQPNRYNGIRAERLQ